MNIDRKTYLMLRMEREDWTDDEELRIMCFNLPAEEIHSILSKARPQIPQRRP